MAIDNKIEQAMVSFQLVSLFTLLGNVDSGFLILIIERDGCLCCLFICVVLSL